MSLFLMFVNLLPFTIGRNVLEVTLINHKEIFGHSLFDVKYFVPIYLSDLFLLLIYQDYFSDKLFRKNKKQENRKIDIHFKISLISLAIFVLLIMASSINHEFASLLILGSFILIKYFFIFVISFAIKLTRKKEKTFIYQLIASSSVFQAIIIFIEQFKGGNIGRFIENRLPGLEIGTRAAESSNLLRSDGTFNEPNITAIFLLMNGVLLIDHGLKNLKTKNNYYLYLITGALSLFTIIFTGSRSLYALTFLCLCFYFIKYKNIILEESKKIIKNKNFKIVILILIITGLPYLLTRINTLKNVLSSDGSLSYRRELNSHVLSLTTSSQLGIGLDLTSYYIAKNFKTVDNQFTMFDQAPAHNIIIQILAETGVFACLIFIFFVYYSLRNGLIKKNNSFAFASLIYFIAAQFHPVFTNHYELTAFFFLYLGLSLDEKS